MDLKKIDCIHDPLTFDEWCLFIRELEKINGRDALIAMVLNFANGFLKEPVKNDGPLQKYYRFDRDGKPKLYKVGYRYLTVSLRSVLHLEQQSVGFNNPYVSFTGPKNIMLIFPQCILVKLQQLCKAPFDRLVFRSANGKPLVENQLKRNFALAGSRVNIDRVSPGRIRLPISDAIYTPYCEISRGNCVCFCKD